MRRFLRSLTSRGLFWVFLTGVFTKAAFGITVNRLNGGANIIYIDFSIAGSVVPLELVRSYNSITATTENTGWLGAFGWGWTSAFETTLTTTPERHVLLRDGATGNTVTFRPEKDDPKARDAFYDSIKKAYFDRKQGHPVSVSEMAKLQLPDKILSRLKTDPQYRLEMAAKYDVTVAIPHGELLISSEYGYQTLQFKNNQWIREKDGVTQLFDNEGRMIRQSDKNGFYFNYKYSTTQRQLMEISDQDKTMSLKFTWRADRIVEIIDNRGHRSRYTYDASNNLIAVTDSNNQAFAYRYEAKRFPHLLTRIDYVTESIKDKVYRELRYDDNGLVLYHRDKDGTEVSYSYGKGTNDPENNFWTKSMKKYKGINEEEYDEYLVKNRPDGSKYLYKQETRLNGVTTITTFTACCGKPSTLNRNGKVTTFKYNESGLLLEKVGPKEDVRLEYDPRWKKVTKINQNGFVSNYEYDKFGNLVKAFNSHKERVALRYDRYGRITEMTDPEGKQINFKYGDTGKPVVIAEKGVGTIKIDYDGEGRIRRTQTILASEKGRKPSEIKSQEVIRKVMKGFQHLLDIIRPAGVNLASG
jgi:YD repeat-containing protein